MNFVSCFSGIEAASVAWHPLGFRCLGVAEVDSFPCAVLAHHLPGVQNLGDVLAGDFLDRVAALGPDAIVGGPPCQDFSVAGLRAGLNGHRGNLTLRWVQIIHASRARFAVTENVPGWLSANNGHAFGAFLAGLVGHDTALIPPKDCGGRWTNAGMVDGPRGRCAWRVLDAQYFGLAQRRKRVFVVFCPTDGADPATILLEQKSLRGDSPPSRATRERVAPTIAARTKGGGGLGTDFDLDAGLISHTLSAARGAACAHGADLETYIAVSMVLNAHGGSGRMDGESETFVTVGSLSANGGTERKHGFGMGQQDWESGYAIPVTHSLRADGFDASEDGTGRGTPLVACEVADSITVGANQTYGRSGDIASSGSAVRRLTPRECERLQGFPDDFTLIPYRGKPAADGPRYRALGNSMAVPVMRWIGRRIEMNTPRSPAPGEGKD